MSQSSEMAVNAIRHDFTSKTNGRDYRLFISIPPGEAPPQGWPVVWVIDGNLHFGITVDTARIQARWPDTVDAVIVGIGYQTDSVTVALDVRNIDLTPPIAQQVIDSGWMAKMGGITAEQFGRMEAYLDMIEAEAKPLVAQYAPLDPCDNTLVGHSLGGLTTLATLFRHTERFQRYAAISPSIFFADRWVLSHFDAFARRIAAGEGQAQLFLSTGEFEEVYPLQPPVPKKLPVEPAHFAEMMTDCAMVTLPTQLAQRMQPLIGPNFKLKFVVHKEEDHRSVVPAGIAGGIYFNLYRPD